MPDKPEDREPNDDGHPAPDASAMLTLGGESVEVPINTNDKVGE